MPETYILIDFANVTHAVMHTIDFSGATEKYSLELMVDRVQLRLNSLRRKIGLNCELIIVLDNKSIRKKSVYPGYKLGRDVAPRIISGIDEWARRVKPYRVCESIGNEGDDAIASVIALEQHERFIIVSADRDLWQLLAHNVSVYNPIKQVFVQPTNVFQSFKCSPRHIPLHKSLWGDAGDCVPNVMPRQQKHLLPIILNTDGALEEFEEHMDAEKFYLPAKTFELYLKAREQIRVNYSLVKLDDTCELKWS